MSDCVGNGNRQQLLGTPEPGKSPSSAPSESSPPAPEQQSLNASCQHPPRPPRANSLRSTPRLPAAPGRSIFTRFSVPFWPVCKWSSGRLSAAKTHQACECPTLQTISSHGLPQKCTTLATSGPTNCLRDGIHLSLLDALL